MHPAARRHLLILEPDARGHAREWLEHIIAGAAQSADAPYLSLAVPEELVPVLAEEIPPDARDRIHVVALTRRQHAACMHRSLAVSGMARWQAMRHWLRRCGASHGLFLGLDHAVLPLSLGFGVAGRMVSGILFRPSTHYAELGPYRPSWRERVRDRRKDLMYRLMLRNPALDRVFSLDPYFPEAAARRYRRANKIIALPDPASSAAGQSSPSPGGLAGAAPNDRILLAMFGELTERKGVIPLLESLPLLPAEVAERVAVILAGRLDPPLASAARQAADAAVRDRPELWLHLEDRRLAPDELAALVHRARVVLAPYQRFVGSSGILLWAARAGRPVIAQDYGLVGRLVRDHGLGLAVDTTKPRALAAAIEWAAQRHPDALCDQRRMAAFADERTPQQFALDLLGCRPADDPAENARNPAPLHADMPE